jgi:hypothetical protein
MTARAPSRLALAILDRLIRDEPLKGDLIEEFERRQSQWWLWRQVLGALVCGNGHYIRRPQSAEMCVLGIAVIILVSFEAVFVVNVIYWLAFGPPVPNIAGWAYLLPGLPEGTGATVTPTPAWVYAPLLAVAASLPVAWLVARLHVGHYLLSLGALAFSVMLCAVLNLQLPFEMQFLTMVLFVTSLLVAARRAFTAHAERPLAT